MNPVPDGIYQGLTCGQVARALNLSGETVKRALASGALPSWQIVDGRGWRYVRPEDLAAYAESKGLKLNWAALL